MAYNLQQISPLDLKPSTAIGVKIPFDADHVFTSVYTTKDQTKYNLINFLLTDKNERPFNLNFGAGLRSRIFDQVTTQNIEDIEFSIKSQVESNFPNVLVKNLSVLADPDNNTMTIEFSYALLKTNENDSVVIMIQNA